MPYPVKENVQRDLQNYHQRIRTVVDQAWAEWRAMAAYRAKNSFAPFLYSRTVANIMFDGIARYAIAEFGGDPSVHVEIESQTVKLFFKGTVFARFKKGDDNKLGQNIPTQAALAFEFVDGMLPGLPAETAKVEMIIQGLRARNLPILIISHSLDQVNDVCDTALWLENGRIKEAGRVEDLIPAYERSLKHAA